MTDELDPLREARAAYAEGRNVMRLFRDRDPAARNSSDAVLISYDLQSGSYRRALEDPAHRALVERYWRGVTRVLDDYPSASMLEVGCGEATTLLPVLAQLKAPPARVAAFDLAWSRIAHARAHARGFDVPTPELFVGDLFAMPVRDDGFDLVWTSHALEPNGGREVEALAALARVTREWIVLLEPSYELGGAGTREHIEEHGYVRGLPAAAEQLGLEIVRHELLPETASPINETQVLVLRKPGAPEPAGADWRACPHCRGTLQSVKGALFCAAEGLVYPVLDGIPVLSPQNGIVASSFADEL